MSHLSEGYVSEDAGAQNHPRTGERMFLWLPLPGGDGDTKRMRIPQGWLYRVDCYSLSGNAIPGTPAISFVPEPVDSHDIVCEWEKPTLALPVVDPLDSQRHDHS